MLPIVFLTAAALMLLLALVAFWQSVRALFGRGVDEISAAIGGDRAALIDEKNALLRALKDIEFERAVGKVGEADWKRLDASYRARAKDVLAELDKDLGPWREKAEKLAQERLGKSADQSDPRDKPYTKAAKKQKVKAKDARTDAEMASVSAAETAAESESATGSASESATGSASESATGSASESASESATESASESATVSASASDSAALVCRSCATSNDPDAIFCKKCAARLIADAADGAESERTS